MKNDETNETMYMLLSVRVAEIIHALARGIMRMRIAIDLPSLYNVAN